MTRTIVLLLFCAASLLAQTKKILIAGGEQDLIRDLQSVSPKAQIVPVTDDNVMQEIVDADAFIGRITPAAVRAGKRLSWVQVMSAGVEDVLFMSGGTDLRDSKIVLTNNKIVQGPEIADHAMAMLLMLSRQLRRYVNADQQELWDTGRFGGIELRGKTAVVIWLGGI